MLAPFSLWWSRLAAVFVLLSLGSLGSLAHAGDRITGRAFATRSEVVAQGGMVATSQPLATQAAIDILKAGGTAVDAAIAANAVLGVVEPTGCGIGGDLFAIVWDAKTRKLYGLNGSGRSPAALSLEYFQRQQLTAIPPFGPLPVTVPGAVDGWFALHGRFGKLPMRDILAPAIGYAQGGFPLSELIAYYWGINADRLSQFANFRKTFLPGGRAPRAGEIFRNPDLARTYERIARGGRDAFYRGAIARSIDRYMRRVGGFLRAEDLAAHRSEWVEPVSTSYRGYDVWELPPNGQGIAALQILNLLEGYDIRAMGFGSPEYVHAFVEAKKLAFSDRAAYYADMDFAEVPVARLISKEYAAERRQRIDPERAMPSVPAGKLRDGDTVYLSVADRAGNMVSLIQSNYRGMGSGMVADGLGFVLQDRGELFDLMPGRANSYAPKKRPFHTIIPAFVTKDGAPWLSFGVMGGAAQPQMHAQVLVNIIDFGMNLQEAGDAPRILHLGSSQPTGEQMHDGGVVSLESGFSTETVRALIAKGHRLQSRRGGYGGYQAVAYDSETGVYRGASESRKDGHAAGF
ncbi:gamma-glutamyltransferase [Haliangium ochraceum]|uniref:Glutathione hydrolase proenzyme n=1 Tax=Haliangium ochraceum (strain DSM 14365 / JCM 11303 / SMP-2) TaxID=502025 RepID=D0LLB5_HALO1|nr:gamma-glutamyltransferase [Haliangium ochraceum]ACY18611.1 gamma-glutamyltransferase [Haliangium ochraceum DSM 14365]